MDGQATEQAAERPVLICTVHRGVFFGYATDTTGEQVKLKRARMGIYWNTKRGVMELAEVGPNIGSKISARADLDVRGVTMVAEVSPDAVKAWEAAA